LTKENTGDNLFPLPDFPFATRNPKQERNEMKDGSWILPVYMVFSAPLAIWCVGRIADIAEWFKERRKK
jgi:hypothetical protein